MPGKSITGVMRAGHWPGEQFSARSFGKNKQDCDVAAEIQRCIKFADWLARTPAATLVREQSPSTQKPLISVVVPMFNASEWVESAIKSLLIQTENIEIFCVDDASTDDTFIRVRDAFGADGRVCVVRLENNVGPYQIRNWVAARLARGDCLAFHDADDLSHPNRFRMQRSFLEHNGGVACGTCFHQIYPPHKTPWRSHTDPLNDGRMMHNLVYYLDAPIVREDSPVQVVMAKRPPPPWQATGEREALSMVNDSPAMYATMMVRRDAFLGLGGFEGRMRLGADRTFAFRFTRFHAINNLRAVLYTRLVHDDSLTQHPETGHYSLSRHNHFEAFDRQEQAICRALRNRDEEDLLRLCTSDLYHADLKVAEIHAPFPVPLS